MRSPFSEQLYGEKLSWIQTYKTLFAGTFTKGDPLMMIDTLLDMTIGMILGMVASPIMMKAIKILRQTRKVDKILREISEDQQIRWIRTNEYQGALEMSIIKGSEIPMESEYTESKGSILNLIIGYKE